MAEKKLTLEQWIADLNREPDKETIKENEDGSRYIPISVTEKILDEISLGLWDFYVERETYGTKAARGYGRMVITCPVNGEKITRGGDAAISLTGDLRLDSPRLESMILLSCARKFAVRLGRDLNRDRQDAPVTQIQQIDPEFDRELEAMRTKLKSMKSRADAAMVLADHPVFRHREDLKKIVNDKTV